MASLTEFYGQLQTVDTELEKEAEELNKVAAEEYAAGAITARGFMDECEKIAGAVAHPGTERINFAQGSTVRGGQSAAPKNPMSEHPVMKAMANPTGAFKSAITPTPKPPTLAQK